MQRTRKSPTIVVVHITAYTLHDVYIQHYSYILSYTMNNSTVPHI